MKTNAIRLLETLGIRYELREYTVDVNNLSAENVAVKIDLPNEQVFKTLVVKGDRNGVCLAVIPGNAELDLKALAKLSGDRKVELTPLKEVQSLTGYIRGGVTALAGKKNYPVYLDEACAQFDVISVSAGVRGTQILLDPKDYRHATEAKIGSIAKETRQLGSRSAASKKSLALPNQFATGDIDVKQSEATDHAPKVTAHPQIRKGRGVNGNPV